MRNSNSFILPFRQNDGQCFSQPGLLAKRDTLLEKLQTLAKEKKQLSERVEKLAERRDLLEMQSEEIAKVSPREGKKKNWKLFAQKSGLKRLSNIITQKARSILHGENEPGLLDMLTDLEKLLFQMSKTDTSMQQDLDAVSALRDQLSDLGMRMKHSSSELEDINMDKVEERLFALAQLKRKLKRSLPEILALQKEIEENLSFLDACSLDQAHLEKEITAIENELRKIVEQIKPIRHESATLFARKLENQLQDLGFSEHVKVIPAFPRI